MLTRLLAFSLLVLLPALAWAEGGAIKKVLVFTKSSGFEHSVIRDPASTKPVFTPKPGSALPGLAFKILGELAQQNRIEFVYSKDGSLFTPGYLAQFDAFFFYTSGDLTEAGTDKNPPMSPAGKTALLEAVASGKGFFGMHSASDTFHSPGGKEHGPERFFSDDGKVDPYLLMLGGEFIQHGAQQPSRLILGDAAFPGASALASAAPMTEEWYSLKNFDRSLHVILAQDVSGMKGIEYARPNYPSTWTKSYGKGRVFYSSLGHRDDMWNNPAFQALVQAGLDWTLGRINADLTPNLLKITPGAATLPKYVAPAAKK